MKKLLLLCVTVLLFSSCDFIFKERDKNVDNQVKTDKQIVLGNDIDDSGCVISAGYRWSEVRKECIRAFEEGYRLNAIDELKEDDATFSAFIIFDENGTTAELFLPNVQKAVLLKKDSKTGHYTSGKWSLQATKGYVLKSGNETIYAGADIEENQITGNDKQEF